MSGPRKLTGPELLAALQAGELAFITVPEFALIVRMSKTAVYRLAETGELEVSKLGPRALRIPAGAALAFLKQTRITGPPPRPAT